MHLVPCYHVGSGLWKVKDPNQPCLANDKNLSLSQRESLVTLQRKLILAARIRDIILSVVVTALRSVLESRKK